MSYYSDQRTRVGRGFLVAAVLVLGFYSLVGLVGYVVITAVVGR